MNRKRFDFDSIGEAFRAGNRARKKESVQDTIEQPYGPEKTIEDFYKITGYKLTYRDGWYEWGAHMHLENVLFSGENNCTGLKTLPSPLRIKSCLYLKWCKDLETLPDTLEIGGFLSIEYCPRLHSIGDHTEVCTDVYIKGCNNLDRLPLGLRFGRTMQLNDMAAGIVKDTPVIKFVKSIGIEPSKWGYVDAAQWPGNRMDEAFRAGNRARKKESVQDTVDSFTVLTPELFGEALTRFIGGYTMVGHDMVYKYYIKALKNFLYRDNSEIPKILIPYEDEFEEYSIPFYLISTESVEFGALFTNRPDELTLIVLHKSLRDEAADEYYTSVSRTRDPFHDIGILLHKLENPVIDNLLKVNEAFKAGNRARKKESVVDNTNETDSRFPGTGIDAFDDYFRTVYPTPESIQDSNFTNPDDLRTFCNNARNLLKKQYSIVKEDMNMDPCRLDLDWLKWFRGKLREFPQFIWPSHDNVAESVRSITIPEGTEVLVMRLGVFERLETVRLPDSLRKINVDAFSECCCLKNVRFSGNLETIRTSAFYRCMSLGPIHIPASVRTIEFSAFEESGITEFVMDPDCQVEEIERNLCRLCKSLGRIELGSNVKWIKTLAFAFLGDVDEVVLPAGLSQGVIEKNAFKNTRIKTVYIKGEDQYDNTRGLSGFESIRQKVLEATNCGEPEFISIP